MSRSAYMLSRETLLARLASHPIEQARKLYSDADPLAATRELYAENPFARAALAVASPSLAATVDAWIAGQDPGEKAKMRAFSYALRMSTRTTPFGLFAGVSAVGDDDGAALRIDAERARTRTRLDMSVVAGMAERASSTQARAGIRYRTNECCFVRGERLHVIDVALGTGEFGLVEQRDVSLRHTRAVGFVRELCTRARRFDAIVTALSEEFGASSDESTRLLDQLISVGVLVSELRASTTGDPAAHIERALRAAGADLSAFQAANAAIAAFDALPVYAREPDDYAVVIAATRELDEKAEYAAQVDLNLPCGGMLPQIVLDDVAMLGELFARSGRVFRMNRFRERFIERYEGRERLVPLLELVDATSGLGLPDTAELVAVTTPERDARLVQVMTDALVRGAEEIELDDELCELLCPSHGGGRPVDGFEMGFALHAPDETALERGDYRVVATFASDRPAKTTARFASMLGETFESSLREVVRRAYHPGDLVAEFSFAPIASRTYNVCVRPLFHRYELYAGIGAESDADTLSAADIYVGINDDDTFYLWSKRLARRVLVAETHALGTAVSAPNLCRFLAQVQLDGLRVPEIELGAAESLAHTPRLVRGRCVLRPRRWNVMRDSLLDRGQRDELRDRWKLPRYAYVVDGDQRLLLDLESPVVTQLLQVQTTAATVRLEEALPSPDGTWLRGPRGSHAVEFVANLTSRDIASRTSSGGASFVQDRCRYGPASSWLYVKYYTGARFFDELLLRAIAPRLDGLEREGLIDGWFFVRYADPRPHLRVRMRLGDREGADAVRTAVALHAEALLEKAAIERYVFDTYEPEYERYGGSEHIGDAERFFFADTRQCLAFLAEGHSTTNSRIEAATAALSDWLASSAEARERALRIFATAAAGKLPPFDRDALRRLKTRVPAHVPFSLDEVLRGDNTDRRLGAYTHMHCNRYGLDGEGERRVVRLVRSLALAHAALTATR